MAANGNGRFKYRICSIETVIIAGFPVDTSECAQVRAVRCYDNMPEETCLKSIVCTRMSEAALP